MKDKIYIFDFDLTITKRHTGGGINTKKKFSEAYIRNNVKSGFKEVVEHIIDMGFGIYIASLGDSRLFNRHEDGVAGHELIRRYVNTIFGEDQAFFKFPEQGENNLIERYGNVIAKYTLDFKDFHLGVIANNENLKAYDPASLKKIIFIDDDVENVCYFYSRGCSILYPTSCQKSADMARNKMLFQKMLNDFRKQ